MGDLGCINQYAIALHRPSPDCHLLFRHLLEKLQCRPSNRGLCINREIA